MMAAARLSLWPSWLQSCCLLALAAYATAQRTVTVPRTPVGSAPPLPPGQPHPPPAYMQDNVNNFFGTAPDKGSLTGPVLTSLNETTWEKMHHSNASIQARQTSSYWLASAGSAGQMPLAPSGYQFFRNVMDFGAVGDGVTDDTAAINRAAATYGLGSSTLRCGADCGSTTTLGAVVFFPPGTYLISTPIIQYYYTQFVGDPTNPPTIKGSFNFTGIALFDTDFYIPGGNGSEWYINQSNFYRQIRNFIFDMTGMNWTNTDNGQTYVPAGIHWQVGQATSINYCDFVMSVSTASQSATAVGIYMENGSGGFVSDLTFTGGNIGFLAGSQQFTANNLQFTSCLTAIKQQWDWGFTWHNIYVLSCYIAIDCTAYSGVTDQGTGSISVVDSHFNGVPYAITLAQLGSEQPNIVLDNLLVENSASVVLISGGATLLAGSSDPLYITSWASGFSYFPDGSGGKFSGYVDPAPIKAPGLLDSSGAYFTQSKPQYVGASPVIATSNGVSNDGTGDQTAAINALLSAHVGSVIFFPGGIYQVQGTVKIPVGSIIIGSGWSQIMGTGSYFEDASSPQVMVQVGKPGDVGSMEISDMLFTVKGPTAGAILMEWNVQASGQGTAAMWDSHFRVGGAAGTDLQLANCPAGASSVNTQCMAATLLFHITDEASGYFENVWAWTADHDLDNAQNAEASETVEGIPFNVFTDISIYTGRGILIESQGPTWLYGTAAEHSQLYQYQLSNASTIYLGHMQTETPYYQPNPNSLSPYKIGQFTSDPTFDNCADNSCRGAWALRIVDSSDIFIYSAGFYSFFQNNQLGCAENNDCQLALIQTNYASDLWMYNIFTKGNIQVISPLGGPPPVFFNSTTKDGYTSEIAAWLALAEGGENIGQANGTGSGVVTIDPVIYSEPTASVTVNCFPPCTYVMPPLTLSTDTTFSFPLLTTSLEVGWFTSSAGASNSTYTSVIETTTITIPAVTTSVIPVFDVTVTNNSTVFFLTPSIVPSAFNITDISVISGTTHPPNTRTFYPPPWPGSTVPPTTTTSQSSTGGFAIFPTVTHKSGPPSPTCTHALGCGTQCVILCDPCWIGCPDLGINWWDPNDPNDPDVGPGEPDDEPCETSTYSSCSSTCTITTGPSTTATQICSTTCKTLVGCDTSGSDDGTYTTLACPTLPSYTPFWTAGTQLAPIIGDGGFGGGVDYGSFVAPPTGANPGSVVTVTGSTPRSTTTITVGSVPVATSTKTITTTITPTVRQSTVTITTIVTPTVTATETAVVPPTASASANCAYWDSLVAWSFEIYNIDGWATDGGVDLHHQEDGCGALTGWDWEAATSTSYAKVHFNLPFFIKSGCVERAIVSAGGPKLSCVYQGFDTKKKRDSRPEADSEEAYRLEQRAKAEEDLRMRAVSANLAKRAQTTEGPTAPVLNSSLPYTYSSGATSSLTYMYTPMNWTGYGNTVTFTWTFSDPETTTETSTELSTITQSGLTTITTTITYYSVKTGSSSSSSSSLSSATTSSRSSLSTSNKTSSTSSSSSAKLSSTISSSSAKSSSSTTSTSSKPTSRSTSSKSTSSSKA